MLKIKELFDAIDSMDAKKFVSFISEDGEFKFGNSPKVEGRENIKEAVTGFFKSIKGLKHHIITTWEKEGSIAIQGEVTYTRHNGTKITLPFTNVFEMERAKIRKYLIYADIAPLYSQ